MGGGGGQDLTSERREKTSTPLKTCKKTLDTPITAKKINSPLQMCKNHEFQLFYIQNIIF